MADIETGIVDDEEDLHHEAMELFDVCRDTDEHNRVAQEDDIRFVKMREQWPIMVRQQREREGRPCLTVDQLNPVCRQVVNDARLNKPQIKVKPVDSDSDPETAEILAGLIRNIEYASNADTAYDTAIDYAVSSSRGYFRINTKYAGDDTFDQDLVIERIPNPLAVYPDPYSTEADSSDWNTCFIAEMLSKEQYKRRFPGKDVVSFDDFSTVNAPWFDGECVMIAEWWKREEVEKYVFMLSNGQTVQSDVYMENEALFSMDEEGPVTVLTSRPIKAHKVTQYILSGKEILETVEWPGKYIPIVPVYGDEFVYEGRRHFVSLVRPAIDAQRMKNYWRSTSTELVALAPKVPWIGEEDAFDGEDSHKWATANSQSWAFISHPKGTQAPQRQPTPAIPAGVLQEAMQAGDDIKSITGVYDASLGARSNETSGRAIMARQREGDVSTFHFIDNLSRAIRHAGRILVDLIPHVYSSERVIRTLDAEMNPQSVMIAPNPEAAQQALQAAIAQGDAIQKIYTLGVGKYDVAVESGPSFTTQREEANAALVELLRAAPQYADIIGPFLLKTFDFPGAQELLKQVEERLQAQQQQGGQPDPEQQAKMQETMLKAQEAQAKYELERQKLDVDMMRAETERLKVLHEIRHPVDAPRVYSPQTM